MILNPTVIALLTGSLLVAGMVLHAAYWSLRVLDGWDLASGSERQLALEKKTDLTATLVAWAFGFHVLSLFLFVFVADDLHRLVVGAMCAAGTLHANPYGYPALMLKLLTCLLAGVWLVMNHANRQACDYPLIRRLSAWLLLIVPVLLLETGQLWGFFLNLRADVITSCCGSLFSRETPGVGAGLAGLPAAPMIALFFVSMALVAAAGAGHLATGKGVGLFAAAGMLAFPVSIAAVIAFIGVYFYELPTHHCPFCILQREYHHAGYLIYAAILGGGITSAGAWALMPFRRTPSLDAALPRILKRIVCAGLVFYGTLTALVVGVMAFSDLTLIGP